MLLRRPALVPAAAAAAHAPPWSAEPLCRVNTGQLVALVPQQAAKMANGTDAGDRKATFARNLAALNSQFAS